MVTTSVRIAVWVLVGIGTLEMALSSAAALAGMSSWSTRFEELTRITPSTGLRLSLGVCAGVAAVALAVGFVWPVWLVVGGVLLALDACFVLTRQVVMGDSGGTLIPYLLFGTCGLVAVAAGVVRA